MGEYRNFVPEKNIIKTTQILSFFGISETLMLDQKEMDLLTIMILSSTMYHKSDCYVKLVKINYHDSEYECIFPKIHLIFLSKRDYTKITKINKMLEKYEELGNKKNEEILYNYLKEIIKHLRECEVMEVFSDHIEAFHMKFQYISRF